MINVYGTPYTYVDKGYNEKSKSAKFFAIEKLDLVKVGKFNIKKVKRFFQRYKFQFCNMFCQSIVENSWVRYIVTIGCKKGKNYNLSCKI